MTNSKTLEETKLWQTYLEKTKNDPARVGWTKAICEASCEQLKAVRDTFANYTLHDETHIFNVLDAMSGLLGNRIGELSAGEVELLLLAASLHDIGMVYTEEERRECFNDNNKQRKYYNYRPDLRGTYPEDWDESTRQDYLRWFHPFRVGEVLQQPFWQKQLESRPSEVVAIEVIVAVCRSHGESPVDLKHAVSDPRGALQFLRFKDVDPLFCAILLRLADILDFDNTRAPSVLFTYSSKSEKSIAEWKKHMGSMGFRYSDVPSSIDLPFGAKFSDPTIERTARTFLDWIDDELSNSRSLLTFCCNRWKSFPFPYQIERREIERTGYDFGDFCLTMDQRQIMNLLIGENIYSDRSVFVRELLQNSVDATLLRAKMDAEFEKKLNTDEAKIEFWEWWDDTGELWFRIDDHGTGMTRGMLEKYFLKAGNSYYNSHELKRDLNGKAFSSISRFGIGFLSCFLCGIEAYVSTKYWNPEKNLREAAQDPQICVERESFGLRLDVTGVTGYYTLRSQAILNNHPKPIPAPPPVAPHPKSDSEKDGYRTSPGTTIAIRIDPGKLGAKSLLNIAKQWACFPRMPVYYNGNRLCITQDELIDLAKAEQGIREYDITENEKQSFEAFLPEMKKDYPKIRERIEYFDAGQILGLPKLKILACETRVLVPDKHRIPRNGYFYLISGNSILHKPTITIFHAGSDNEDLELAFCSPDSRRLYDLLSNQPELCSEMHYGWQGIFAYHGNKYHYRKEPLIILLDEESERPNLDASRRNVTMVHLKTLLTAVIWLDKNFHYNEPMLISGGNFNIPLKEWRNVCSENYQKWVNASSWDKYQEFKEALESGVLTNGTFPAILSNDYLSTYYWKSEGLPVDIRIFFLADLQLRFRMTVDYAHQRLEFFELDTIDGEMSFDLFPPMPFCYGKTTADRMLLCSAKNKMRFAVTADHPFTEWLLRNSEMLSQHYPRQFEQIISGLQRLDAKELIASIEEIIDQLSMSASRYGIDTYSCPKLTMVDFWAP